MTTLLERRCVPENRNYVAVRAKELDALEAELAACKRSRGEWIAEHQSLLDGRKELLERVSRLRAEVASLKKDAERYRWLRSSFRVARWDVKYWTGEFWDVMYGDAMDKQIDAARKEGA